MIVKQELWRWTIFSLWRSVFSVWLLKLNCVQFEKQGGILRPRRSPPLFFCWKLSNVVTLAAITIVKNFSFPSSIGKLEDVCCILFLWSYFQAVSAVFILTIKIFIARRIIFHKFLLLVFPFFFVELFADRERESAWVQVSTSKWMNLRMNLNNATNLSIQCHHWRVGCRLWIQTD